MRKLVVGMTALVTLVAWTSIAGGTPTKDSFGLKGEVYAAGFKIEMKNAANRKLTSVAAGTYRIKVEDEATIHNFRLVGPGVTVRRPFPVAARRSGRCACSAARTGSSALRTRDR